MEIRLHINREAMTTAHPGKIRKNASRYPSYTDAQHAEFNLFITENIRYIQFLVNNYSFIDDANDRDDLMQEVLLSA